VGLFFHYRESDNMPKMGFESVIEEVEKGYTWPGTTMQRYAVPAEDLKKYNLQRKKGSDATHYSLWCLGVGESGGQLTYFWGHRLLDAAKAAYEWKYPQQAANGGK
jgi:hypothetical protein